MLPPDIVKQIIRDTVWLRKIDTINHYDKIIKLYRVDLHHHKQLLNELLIKKNNYKEHYKFTKLFTNDSLHNIKIKRHNIKIEIEKIQQNIESLNNNIKKSLYNWGKIGQVPIRYHDFLHRAL
jgi:hypothetical protein